MDGTYIANVWADQAFETPETDRDEFIQSRITFNKGGTWNRIPAPSQDACAADEVSITRAALWAGIDWRGRSAT